MSKLIQSSRFLGKTLDNVMSNLGEKALLDLTVPLAKDLLPKLATKVTSSTKFKRKWTRRRKIKKGFTLFLSNEDMDY